MTEETPFVSVVMPCFNAAPYVAAAIESVRAQRGFAIEIVFVDDGSTDGSAAIAQTYAPTLRYQYQMNAGIAAARNAGIAAARGTFLAFLDADDLWTENSLAARYAAWKASEAPACIFGALENFTSGELTDESRARLQANGETPSAARFPGTAFLRREDFMNVGGFNPALAVGEMIEWLARAERTGLKMKSIDDLVLRRRLHGANTSLLRSPANGRAYLHALRAGLQAKRAAGETS
jgi:glycosyltransferase involved in cell wall biosynthesis